MFELIINELMAWLRWESALVHHIKYTQDTVQNATDPLTTTPEYVEGESQNTT